MSTQSFYGPQHRALQDQFATRPLADLLSYTTTSTFDEVNKSFVERCDMFFLATVDHEGRPTVSYKGGDPGFVQIVDEATLLFPSYDGNGMFLSVGNLSLTPSVGLLFISFEKPQRLRVQGNAVISSDPADLARYPEADLVVRVTPTEVFTNCPRYVHRHDTNQRSRYVPREGIETPLAGWKRIDVLSSVLSPADAHEAQRLGTISPSQWSELVTKGDPSA
jgi:uncharacterized protein